MRKRLVKLVIIGFFAISSGFMYSCSPRNLVYFSDVGNRETNKISVENRSGPQIQSGDLLGVAVSTLNPETNALFNNVQFNNSNIPRNPGAGGSLGSDGYMVDNNGFIDFPVVGPVALGGLTKEEAKEKIREELMKFTKGTPMVNIRFLNFKVTVIGEVARPSTFPVTGESITILEALGMAGDMTPFGKRENVLVIREKNGVRDMTRINLNSKDVMNSPYFYLQQNDVVYVEPDKAKALQSSSSKNYYLPLMFSVASFASLLLWRVFR